MKFFGIAAAFVLLGNAAPGDESQTFRSRIPQAHVDAFVNDCAKDNVPRATCVCMVRKFNETAPGAALLDITGMFVLVKDEAARKSGVTAALNRHGLRGSQFLAFADPKSGNAEAVAKDCE